MRSLKTAGSRRPDAIVIGGGLVGLAVADALAERGAAVALVSETRVGESSWAGAGMLAPTVEPLEGAARTFALAARERFPDYLRALEERTGIAVPLDRRGILSVAQGDERAHRLRGDAAGDVRWLDAAEVARLEPSLGPVLGALLHPLDGAVDNVILLEALRRAVAARPEIRILDAAAAGVERVRRSDADLDRGETRQQGVAVRLSTGERVEAAAAVLAAGAWSAQLAGLPRTLPVEPARGQMIALAASEPRHVVYGDHAYLVPRPDGRMLVGATMEHVGFDHSTTPEALAMLHREAGRLVPALAHAPQVAGWAGLRPMSPDALPILGPDPDWPALLYACGHSRNGILMAPITGDAIAALVLGEEPPFDLSAFSIERFPEPARMRSGGGGPPRER